MTPSETIGLIVGLAAILEAGFVAGNWRANKQRHAMLDEAVAARLRQIIGAVEITSLNCDVQEVTPAQTIGISYDILSEATFPYQVCGRASLVAGKHCVLRSERR